MPALLSILTPFSLPSSSVSLSYFNLAAPMRECLGKHSRMIIIIIKKGPQCILGESDIHPVSPKTPAPQYQPIDRKKIKGKRVEDYSRDRAA